MLNEVDESDVRVLVFRSVLNVLQESTRVNGLSDSQKRGYQEDFGQKW